MKNNTFYILKGTKLELNNTYKWDDNGKQIVSNDGIYSTDIFNVSKNHKNEKPIFMMNPSILYSQATIFMFNGQTFLGKLQINKTQNFKIELLEKTTLVSINIKPSFDTINLNEIEKNKLRTQMWFYVGSLVNPHYKSIKIKSKKEANQEFFRRTIDGQIKLFGQDFDYVNKANIEYEMIFAIFSSSNKLISANKFSKTDCKLNLAKKSIELKLEAIDKYTNILNKYENTYDLLKINTPTTPLILSKRFAIQTYIAGADTYSCFSSNGTYFEDEVNETIDNEDELTKKYYFAKAADFYEINISQQSNVFSKLISYVCTAKSTEWLSNASSYVVGKGTDEYRSYIKLNKVANKGDNGSSSIIQFLYYAHSGEKGSANHKGEYLYDVYRFELRIIDKNGNDSILYHSQNYYYILNDYWYIGQSVKVQMNRDDGSGPSTFILGDDNNNVITYSVFARMICDVDSFIFNGTKIDTYDYPYDDFIIDKANYKKCIGIVGSVIKLYQSSKTVNYPTKFGINDFNDTYFTSNIDEAFIGDNAFNRPMPVSRSTWANSSIWAIFNKDIIQVLDNACLKKYTIKDAYRLSDVIRAILNKIDTSIYHENDYKYSTFLYGTDTTVPDNNISLVNKEIFIIPKSNVLKGNYDQAAQKAEITMKQIMDMLKYCFKAYWYVDDFSRLIIEHIRYFNNSGSYTSSPIVSSMLNLNDKFNKKNTLYSQTEISYNKSDLQSRFEFKWMDDSSDIFEGPTIDVKSTYVQQDKTETITPENFSSDIDLMLLSPDKFSSDGFALVVASKYYSGNNVNYEVPITLVNSLVDEEYKYPYDNYVQNYFASWTFLEKYYMYDMPAKNIEYNMLLKNSLVVKNIYRSMQHDIEFNNNLGYELNLKNLYKTEIGNGKIEEIAFNIDTNLMSASLVYEPK